MFRRAIQVSVVKPTTKDNAKNKTEEDRFQKYAETTLDVLGKVGYGLAIGVCAYVAADTVRQIAVTIVKAKV